MPDPSDMPEQQQAQETHTPPLHDNDVLKPSGSPWLWYGLLLFGILVLVVGSIKSSHDRRVAQQRAAAEAVVNQNAPANPQQERKFKPRGQ